MEQRLFQVLLQRCGGQGLGMRGWHVLGRFENFRSLFRCAVFRRINRGVALRVDVATVSKVVVIARIRDDASARSLANVFSRERFIDALNGDVPQKVAL